MIYRFSMSLCDTRSHGKAAQKTPSTVVSHTRVRSIPTQRLSNTLVDRSKVFGVRKALTRRLLFVLLKFAVWGFILFFLS